MDMTEDNFASEELFKFDDELDLEDEEPAELNVENHFWNVSTTGGNIPLKITLFTLEESDCFPWVNNFLAKVTQNDQLVACVLARLIQRGTVRRSFWEHMDDLCRDTSNIAFELFDRYGRLKQNLKDHMTQGALVSGRLSLTTALSSLLRSCMFSHLSFGAKVWVSKCSNCFWARHRGMPQTKYQGRR
jgi:hypothetical protein